MKSILMSIRPEWCKKIFDGEKSIEVRKTRPLIDMPFKVYVYCTKERMTKVPSMYAYLHKNEPRACAEYGTIEKWGKIGDVIVNPHLASKHVSYGMHGKVIGSFVCDRIREIIPLGLRGFKLGAECLKEMCLSKEQLDEYGGLKTLYSWHITEPKLFDKPRELGEFSYPAEHDFTKRTIKESREMGFICHGVYITRPPQSYCYVEADER